MNEEILKCQFCLSLYTKEISDALEPDKYCSLMCAVQDGYLEVK